jgi:hypothetical protein
MIEHGDRGSDNPLATNDISGMREISKWDRKKGRNFVRLTNIFRRELREMFHCFFVNQVNTINEDRDMVVETSIASIQGPFLEVKRALAYDDVH